MISTTAKMFKRFRNLVLRHQEKQEFEDENEANELVQHIAGHILCGEYEEAVQCMGGITIMLMTRAITGVILLEEDDEEERFEPTIH